MKKWNSLLIAILYLSLNACIPASQSDEKPPLVDYCDLVENSEHYDKQVVRVHTKHVTGFEWSYLMDENCSGEVSKHTTQTWIIIPGDPVWCEGSVPTSSALPHGFDSLSIEREVTVVGTFYIMRGDLIGEYPFRMDLICLESAGIWQGVPE